MISVVGLLASGQQLRALSERWVAARREVSVASGFAAEADMLGLIAAAAPSLAGSGAFAAFEVQAAAGVPDVVAAVLNTTVIANRMQTGFITEHASLAALLALSDALSTSNVLDAHQVAVAVGVGVRYASSVVLPGLVARNLARSPEPGRWIAAGPYESPAVRVVTVEAKLRDWRRGLGQAARHAAGADAAWLILDSARTRPAEAYAGWFRTAGVGLAALNEDGRLEPLLAPGGANVLRVRRELLAERTAALYSSGVKSGPIGLVFGRNLTSTTGADPRLAGAAVH